MTWMQLIVVNLRCKQLYKPLEPSRKCWRGTVVIQFYYFRLALSTYDELDLGYFLCSTDVTSYCDLGISSLRDLLGSIYRPKFGWKDPNTIGLWYRIPIYKILLYKDYFLLIVNEWIELISFIGYFDGTRNDVDGTFVCMKLGSTLIASDISVNNLNKSSPVSCWSEI